MAGFVARGVELTGGFPVPAPVAAVFDLFSPLGEQAWVPGWEPELLHPHGVAWAPGQVFRTREETGEAVWIVTALDREAHHVEYHRVEPGRYVARVRVRCAAAADGGTRVSTAYAFVGLSVAGNGEIAAMTQAAYSEKMSRWRGWILDHLERGAPAR